MSEFNYAGRWNLPEEQADIAGGYLKLDYQQGLRLSLFTQDYGWTGLILRKWGIPDGGTVVFHPLTVTVPIVEGITERGDVCLFECRSIASSFNRLFSVKYAVFVSEPLKFVKEPMFQRMLLHLSHLRDFMDVSGLRSDDHSITYNQLPSSALVDLPDIRANIQWQAGSGLIEKSIHERTYYEKPLVSIEFSEPRPFDDVVDAIHKLRTFFAFATGQPVEAQEIRVSLSSDCVLLDEADDLAGSGRNWVEFVYDQPGRLSNDLKSRNSKVFTFSQVESGLQEHVTEWFKHFDALGPVIGLYLTNTFRPGAYVEAEFLSLMQALEGFHNRCKFHPRGNRSLEAKIETIFKDKDILGKYENIVDRIFPERDKWIERTVATRDFFTHRVHKMDPNVVDGPLALHELNKQLRLLLQLCLLRHIEVPNQAVEKITANFR